MMDEKELEVIKLNDELASTQSSDVLSTATMELSLNVNRNLYKIDNID